MYQKIAIKSQYMHLLHVLTKQKNKIMGPQN